MANEKRQKPLPAPMPGGDSKSIPGYTVYRPGTQGHAMASSMLPTAELDAKDRDELQKLRERAQNMATLMQPLLTAERMLSRIDEGPVSGRVGNWMSMLNVGPNADAYQTLDRVTSNYASEQMRNIGGNDTETEWLRQKAATVSATKTPKYNMDVIAEAKHRSALAEAEAQLAEKWVSNFGSLTAPDPKTGKNYSSSVSSLRKAANMKFMRQQRVNSGGWVITEKKN